MGQYFNPVDTLETQGRRLSGGGNYRMLISQLQPDEQLVGLYDRGLYKTAPYLNKQTEFDHFEESYNCGLFISREFYAVRCVKEESEV